jgi:hypothetical protein
VGQKNVLPAGKSSDSASWEIGEVAVRFPELGPAATGPVACLAFAMTDNVASI